MSVLPCSGSLAVGAGKIAEIDTERFVFGVELFFDGGEGAEEEIGGVGHDGSAARGDLVAGLKFIEFAEGMVDGDGGAEFLVVADQRGGKVRLIEILLTRSGVLGAEAGGSIRYR